MFFFFSRRCVGFSKLNEQNLFELLSELQKLDISDTKSKTEDEQDKILGGLSNNLYFYNFSEYEEEFLESLHDRDFDDLEDDMGMDDIIYQRVQILFSRMS